MADIYPPVLTSTVGRIRKYIPDLVLLEDPKDPSADPSYYFSDLELAGFAAEYSDADKPARHQIRRAAADALDALANNDALVLKKIKTEDLETDGPAVANALRRGAMNLRNQADVEEAEEGSFFELVPFRHHHPQTRLPGRYGIA